MQRSRSGLSAATGLAVVLTLALFGPCYAQRDKSDDGTGAGAGYSPSIEPPVGGAAPDAAAPMNAPPLPPDESAGQGAPAPATEQAPPDEGEKKDGGIPPSDAPTGTDQPD